MDPNNKPLTEEEFQELLQSLRDRRDHEEATRDDYYDPDLWNQK